MELYFAVPPLCGCSAPNELSKPVADAGDRS